MGGFKRLQVLDYCIYVKKVKFPRIFGVMPWSGCLQTQKILPGNVCRKGLKFPEIPGNPIIGPSLCLVTCSPACSLDPPQRFPGLPGYIGSLDHFLDWMLILIFSPRLVQWSGGKISIYPSKEVQEIDQYIQETCQEVQETCVWVKVTCTQT